MSGCTSSALFWSGVPVTHQRCRADSAMHALKLSECLFFHNTHAERMPKHAQALAKHQSSMGKPQVMHG